MAKKEKNTPKKTVKSVNVEEKKIEEIVEVPETPVETGVKEEVKEQVEEEVLPAVEEKKEEKPNKKSCDCKRQLTTKDVFGYMWMGQIYGE